MYLIPCAQSTYVPYVSHFPKTLRREYGIVLGVLHCQSINATLDAIIATMYLNKAYFVYTVGIFESDFIFKSTILYKQIKNVLKILSEKCDLEFSLSIRKTLSANIR